MNETKSYPTIHLGSPGEDISKKDLHAITQRFKNLNQLRLKRVQDFLQPRQQVFLQLLALLFHKNHPLLPGFISSETATGIPDYHPNKQTILAAKQFSKSFSYKKRALLRYPIQGIFIMGSVSSIAFSKTSDIDVWLCYQPGLSSEEIVELQQKASAIENWALTYHLEVHFFLINSEQFSQGQHAPISSESSGNTQHYLLLEEFYRTAIFIAGRIPAWWLVPPQQEKYYTSYLKHLIDNRFISKNEIIDFGGLESIPAEEFISATLWHIYKSLNSPHKSLLKLFLMECYASEFPQPEWLCFELKNAIYQGSFNIDQLDPYLLIYAKVEHYLQKTESTERLTLARQCFYLKIMGETSNKALDYHSRAFRETYMESIAKQWNWPDDLLFEFKKQKNWNIKKATQEHLVIRTELKHCLRMIMGLANKYVAYNYRDNNDLKVISRKLNVFLERKPGRIEIITTRSTVHSKENELSIIESCKQDRTSSWSLYAGKFDPKKPHPDSAIKQETSLLSLLAWLVINGLYKKQCQLHFESSSLQLSNTELQQILSHLAVFLLKHFNKESTSLTVFNKPDKLLSSLVFINLGIALIDQRKDGLLIMSERSDPLSYGKNRQCFVQQADQISVSSWGEVSIKQFIGLNEFFTCLSGVFNQSSHPVSKQILKILCLTPTRGKSITLRIESVFENLISHFFKQSTDNNCRYILPGEHNHYIFQNKNNQLLFWPLTSKEQLLEELGSAQKSFSPVYFDKQVLENTLIPFLYNLNQQHTIQVFYYAENETVSIYIIDEKGALFIQDHKKSNHDQVLSHYSIFLESLLNQGFSSDEVRLKYYEIQKNSAQVFSAHAAKWITTSTQMDLPLKIIIENSPEKKQAVNYHIYCNDIEFSSSEYGEQLFSVLYDYVMDFRIYKEDYPVHITDIEAPWAFLGAENDTLLQTIHYLKLKRKIEQKFNF